MSSYQSFFKFVNTWWQQEKRITVFFYFAPLYASVSERDGDEPGPDQILLNQRIRIRAH